MEKTQGDPEEVRHYPKDPLRGHQENQPEMDKISAKIPII